MTSIGKISNMKPKKSVNIIFISHQSIFLCIAIGAFLIANTSFLIGEQLRFYQSVGLSFIWALVVAFLSESTLVLIAAFGMATKMWFRRMLSYDVVLFILAFNYYHPHTHVLITYFGKLSPNLGASDPLLFDEQQILIMLWNLILGSCAGYLLRNLVRSELVKLNH
ncbi:MAG: hypothetical protein AB8G05_23390 [Oligoflexales bacterium]